VPYPFDAATARLRLAAMHRVRGANSEAVLEARAALSVFESLEAAPSADVARRLLVELGAMPDPANGVPHAHALSNGSVAAAAGRTASPFVSLTARELDIVRLVARRLSNKEIGAALGITARTAGTHLANVFGKVGVRDRTGLGDLAREHGLHDQLASPEH
jgi:DNA-binding CsgD family transcriptional regulator